MLFLLMGDCRKKRSILLVFIFIQNYQHYSDLPADAQSTWALEEDSNLHFYFDWSTGRRLCFAHAVFSTEDMKGFYKLSHFRTTSLAIPEHYQKKILRMDFEIKDNIVCDYEMKILYAKIGAEVGRIVL